MRDEDFLDRLLEVADLFPSRKAITDKAGNSVSYRELSEGIVSVSRNLRKLLPAKSKVLFLLPGTPKNMVKALGVLHAGHALVISDPFTSTELFQSRAKLAGATHILADKRVLLGGQFRKAVKTVTKKQIADVRQLNLPIFTSSSKDRKLNTDSWLVSGSKEKLGRVGSVTDSAVIVFTSGTTDNPKGVAQSFMSLTAGLEEVSERFQVTHNSTVLSEPMTLGLVALTSGAEWLQGWKQKDLPSRVDVWFGTPYDANLLAQESEKASQKPRIRTVGVGAGPVLPALVSRIEQALNVDRILCVYGMTEILPISIGDAREKHAYLSAGDYVGEPLQNVSVRTQDGELEVSGPGVAEYLNYENREWLATGDYAEIVEDSDYEGSHKTQRVILKGRKKDMFIREDMNIYPGLYEPAINNLPGVAEACLTGVPGRFGDEYIVLAVKPQNGVQEAGLKQKIWQQLPKLMDAGAIPDSVVFLNELPKSGRANKLDRERLKNIVSKRIANRKT